MTPNHIQYIRAARVTAGALLFSAAIGAVKDVSPLVSASTATKSPEFSRGVADPNNLFQLGALPLSRALECITDFVLKIHAPKDRPDLDVTGTRVKVYNAYNRDQYAIFVARLSQNYNPSGRYERNSTVEGTNKESVLLFGTPDGQRPCDNNVACLKTPGGKFVKQTTIVGEEVDEKNNPVLGSKGPAALKVDCPEEEICPWGAGWAIEKQQVPPTLTPTATATPTRVPPAVTPPPGGPPVTGDGSCAEGRCE